MNVRSPRSGRSSRTRSIINRLSQRTGLDFSGCHQDRMVRLVGASALVGGPFDEVDVAQLERDEAQYDELIDRLTVGETYFFREPGHFRLLRDRIAPAVTATVGRRGIRAWSAGCASGEEPYSIAITLDELGLLEQSRILGTDISRRALDRAAAATYRSWSLRRCDHEETRRWFEPDDDRLRLRERYRSGVDWQARGLLDGPPAPAAFDVVFCRNVLIYLTSDSVDAATRTLHDAVVPGGWLLTGAADPVLTHPGLQPEVTPYGLVYQRMPPRRGTATNEPARRLAPTRALPAPPSPPSPSGRTRPDVRSPERSPMSDAHDDARRRFLAAGTHLAAGRVAEAAAEAAAAVYLDPDLIVGQLLLAHCHDVLGHAGRAEAGRRHALSLLVALPADAVVDMTEGERAEQLVAVVVAHLQRAPGRR